MKRLAAVIILALSFCGIADSAYIAKNELQGAPLLCTAQNLSGCNTVASSPYARLFGVPVAEYGVFFYGVVFVLAALELILFDRLLRRVLQGVALAGVAASLYFTVVQVYFIGAFCTYCSVSAGIALLVLVCASLMEPIRVVRKRCQQAPFLSMPPTA